MHEQPYDIIVIGAGSGGLSVALFMNKANFKVLLIDKTDAHIGGECLNDGCVPSKAFIHVAKMVHQAHTAQKFGLSIQGSVDMQQVMKHVTDSQQTIRDHENAEYFRKQGIDIVLGEARFKSKNTVEINGKSYAGKKIVIATGSAPLKLKVPGVENVVYFDNENIFKQQQLPKRLLVIGGGPIGIEIGQAMSRLGSKVTIAHRGEAILEHDDKEVTSILMQQLQKDNISFVLNADVSEFTNANEAVIKLKDGTSSRLAMDAVFVGIGRELRINNLALENAGIEVKDGKIVVNDYLQTTNKNVFVGGDVAGSLQFSHAAEQHGRLLLNNFFSPFRKKLDNKHMSWVTFTDPEVATFGIQEHTLKKRGIHYRRLDTDFKDDDRAITDNHRYGKLVLFISQGSFLHKEKILGGTMVAPGAGELIQELILANTANLPISSIFNKIYPYPVATRINQKAIVQYKQESLTSTLKKLLKMAFKIFG